MKKSIVFLVFLCSFSVIKGQNDSVWGNKRIIFPEGFVVVIDPGHGFSAVEIEAEVARCPDGRSDFTVEIDCQEYYNPDCRCEFEIFGVLEISQMLLKILEERTSGGVFYVTRNTNFVYLKDTERVRFVNNIADIHGKVDLYLSLHFNAYARRGQICTTVNNSSTWSGVEAFYCDHLVTNDEAAFAKKLAEKMALAVSDATGIELNRNEAQERDHWRRKDHFLFFKNCVAKAKVLLELGYQTHPDDREILADKEARQDITEALFEMIVRTWAKTEIVPAPTGKIKTLKIEKIESEGN